MNTDDPLVEAVENGLDEVQQNVNKSQKELREEIKTLKNRVDAAESKAGRLNTGGNQISFKDQLQTELATKADNLRALKDGTGGRVNMQVKASISDDAREGATLPGVHFDPDRTEHISMFLPQASTNGNSVPYLKETAYTDGTEGQTEGEVKGENNFTITQENASVETRASFISVPKQMLDDVSVLSSYLSRKMTSRILVDEDTQLLYGTGVSPQITGLTLEAAGWSPVLNTASFYDCLADASRQAEVLEYNTDTILLHKNDYWKMATEKTSGSGEYLHPAGVRSGTQRLRVDGIRCAPTTAVAEGEFLVGDFTQGATYVSREGVNVRFFEQDSDNVQRNLVTVRAEQRIALAIHNPLAFVYGRFAQGGVS
ncbi:phage major capsid protein, HK97 family [Fodinibius roseus]|uniref:Phage major capsid protein, HK97 family n=1 Tax=Fodinibius roseus TaxID=1194090 RepID=A0A1M5C8K2_9BACT|nr:phage major capsid protein [Fodinibius roseus]SHF50722.1 phage major capsid protein, HK97 family [Fodinibius roseus]